MHNNNRYISTFFSAAQSEPSAGEVATADNYFSGASNIFQFSIRTSATHSQYDIRPFHLYDKLEDTIRHLSTMEPDCEDYISPEACKNALYVVAILRHARISVPRIIPGDEGEDLTFTWDISEVKRFLTIDIDSWHITHLNKKTKERAFKSCPSAISAPNDLLKQLGTQENYSSKVDVY